MKSSSWLGTCLGLVLAGCAVSGAGLPPVRVAPGGRGFEAGGRPFVPFGVTYFRPGTGWAPQVWKQFDEDATRKDFVRLRAQGVNCVRVFLTYGSFMTEPGIVNAEGLAKFDRFLALAEEAGMYVHPTGPDHWEGLPEWAQGDRYADETVLSALERFWLTLAGRVGGRGTVFAFDLLNEPEVRWDTPAMREKWNHWAVRRHVDLAGVASAWGVPVGSLSAGDLPVPAAVDKAGDALLLDYQRFRESVADEWTRRQAAAIRKASPGALVTAGLIQWSVPVVLAHAAHYSGFRPERQAGLLDFMEVHFYPLANGAYAYGGPEEEAKNLAYLDSVVREVGRFGKPVVLAEFGWYGGGQPRHVGGVKSPASEAQQAAWCRQVVESTAGLAHGWLHWGFYDQPEAGDVTELIGLARPDGTLKAWGRDFEQLSRRFRSGAWKTPSPGPRPILDWDACITSAEARREFAARYLEAWKSASGPR